MEVIYYNAKRDTYKSNNKKMFLQIKILLKIITQYWNVSDTAAKGKSKGIAEAYIMQQNITFKTVA